jgi:putative ABC transport system permease protein
MRKVLGAHRGQLVRQFFGESALLAFFAFIFAIALAMLMLPAFNRISLKSLSLGVFLTPGMLLAVVALLAAITVGAGLYPSLVLSAFRPSAVLKGGRHGLTSGDWLRKSLVVFQFGVTVFLLVSMSVVYRQLNFIKTTDVGFDREQIVVVPLADAGAVRALPTLKQNLAQNPRILSMSAMNNIPGAMRGGYSLYVEGEDPAEAESRRIAASPVDDDAVETLGLHLLAGSSFSEPEDYLADPDSSRYEYVINESLVRLAGWTPESAIGKRMGVSQGRMGQVVGVIRDFNFLSLRDEMQPLALFVEPSWNVLLVKIAPTDVSATIASIRDAWTGVAAGSPFSYTFLDDEFAAFYDSEHRLGGIFTGATILAILIACLGLFGLASYTAEARTKEIGIRKSLGASVPGLVARLNRDFARLVVLGFVLATPLAWWAARSWLEGYAYRTHLSWWIFVASGAVALLIALATVSYQSIRAANSDPVHTLRYE